MNTTYIKATSSGSGGTSISTATLMKTGQTTSYRTGDDGDLEAGRNVDFFTLAENNPFGNTNRFTDELGGSTYTNNIVIDWSTFNGSTVLGWYRIRTSGQTWNNAIDNALLTSIGTFTSGWRLPNVYELASIMNFNTIVPLNYSPINLSAATTYLSSTTLAVSTTQCYNISSTGILTNAAKTSTLGYIPCRTFTVTGTTLS